MVSLPVCDKTRVSAKFKLSHRKRFKNMILAFSDFDFINLKRSYRDFSIHLRMPKSRIQIKQILWRGPILHKYICLFYVVGNFVVVLNPPMKIRKYS